MLCWDSSSESFAIVHTRPRRRGSIPRPFNSSNSTNAVNLFLCGWMLLNYKDGLYFDTGCHAIMLLVDLWHNVQRIERIKAQLMIHSSVVKSIKQMGIKINNPIISQPLWATVAGTVLGIVPKILIYPRPWRRLLNTPFSSRVLNLFSTLTWM